MAQQAKKNVGEFFQVFSSSDLRMLGSVKNRNAAHGRIASSVTGRKNQNGWMCWKTGVR